MRTLLPWAVINFFVVAMLALDLGVFHCRAHVVRFQEAVRWSLAWVVLAPLFCAGLYLRRGREAAREFLSGYILEKSLSPDNIFVFEAGQEIATSGGAIVPSSLASTSREERSVPSVPFVVNARR